MTRFAHIVTVLLAAWAIGAGPALGQSGGVRADGVAGVPVEITFLDVGQGDAVLIRGPDDRWVMIDGGPASPLRDLVRLGVRELALVVASHAHADHIGGLQDVLTARPVDSYMDNGMPHTTATYRELMAHVERIDVRYLEAAPRTITLGPVSLEVLPLPPDADQQNDASVGLVLRYGDFAALFTGDSERAELEYWRRSGVLDDVTLLKAPHHGAVNGFSYPFLDEVRPEVVVISAGAGNSYGHPRPEALTAYGTFAEEVLRTDLHGEIVVRGYPDGSFEIEVEGQEGDAAGEVVAGDSRGHGASLRIEVIADAAGNDNENLNGEYAVIENLGPAPRPIGLWRLCDLSSRCFRFPPDAVIGAGRRVVVYTGYGSSDGVSFFMNNQRAVWNNDGDEATLFDANGNEIARTVYEE